MSVKGIIGGFVIGSVLVGGAYKLIEKETGKTPKTHIENKVKEIRFKKGAEFIYEEMHKGMKKSPIHEISKEYFGKDYPSFVKDFARNFKGDKRSLEKADSVLESLSYSSEKFREELSNLYYDKTIEEINKKVDFNEIKPKVDLARLVYPRNYAEQMGKEIPILEAINQKISSPEEFHTGFYIKSFAEVGEELAKENRLPHYEEIFSKVPDLDITGWQNRLDSIKEVIKE